MATPTTTNQADSAIKFYESRWYNYDDTWHPDFTKRFMSHISSVIKPGQQILDLACGTGLLTFLEAGAVGPTGYVIGIDVTPGMIAAAKHKKESKSDEFVNVSFYKGDVIALDGVEALKGQEESFDVITVASALVLFPDPKAAIEHWSRYLKPGGVLALDSTHPRNLVAGMVLERTARRLGLPISYNREWSQSEDSLRDVLESAGLQAEKVVMVEEQAGYGRRFHGVEEWDDFFVENVIAQDVAQTFASNEIRTKAQGVFKEEWEKLAVEGKVEEVDAVFLGIARRPADGSRHVSDRSSEQEVFRGGCRCGSFSYTSTARPSDIVVCHCRACQQVSGSGFLPFVRVPSSSLRFTSLATRKVLKLSDVADRTFCTGCGAPLTMVSLDQPAITSLTMASVDVDSMTCEMPQVEKHIFVDEKAPWAVLPEDGRERRAKW